LGNLEGGSFAKEFEEWIKGALEVEDISLREICEGNLEGRGLLYRGPWRMCKEGSGEGHFSP
jgi:hypothetical protein